MRNIRRNDSLFTSRFGPILATLAAQQVGSYPLYAGGAGCRRNAYSRGSPSALTCWYRPLNRALASSSEPATPLFGGGARSVWRNHIHFGSPLMISG
jgi:hypothetical protein